MAMFRPTYQEIIDRVNEENGETTFTSRYSVVIAASRRARQIVAARKPDDDIDDEKPLTRAVNELFDGEVTVRAKDPD